MPKIEKELNKLIMDPKRFCDLEPMCRAFESLNNEVLKNAYQKFKIYSKNKRNVSLENENFEFLAILSRFKF